MVRSSFLGLSAAGFHRVSYTDWGAPDARHIVVCVHGLTRNARDFDTLAGAIEHRCRVLCPDIAGRGQSDWLVRKEDYGYVQYLADMTALIARATARAGPDAIVDWVGTSMGGMLGMLLAGQPNTPIRRLVLNDVGPLIPKAALERIATYVGKAPSFANLDEAQAYVSQVSATFGPLSKDQWRHLTVHNTREGPDGRLHMNYDPGIATPFAAGPAKDVLLWNVWDRIGCPVLAMRGADSDLLLPETAREMTVRGPRARLVEFAGVGHAPALMAADQVAAVQDFLFE